MVNECDPFIMTRSDEEIVEGGQSCIVFMTLRLYVASRNWIRNWVYNL